MAAPAGYRLAATYTGAGGVTLLPLSNQPPWRGGGCARVIASTAMAANVVLQYVAQQNIVIPVLTFSTNGIYVLELPAGQYQLSLPAGAYTNFNADIVSL